MNPPQDRIEREALDWLVAINDPDFDRWQAWDDWLAADPAHADTYWRLDAREAEIVSALRGELAGPYAAERARPTAFWRSRRGVLTGLAAAAAVAVVALVPWHAAEPSHWEIVTARGETRDVRLADGTRIQLNGMTRLRGDRARPRRIILDRGQATFTVVHDADHPFAVVVGDAIIRDLGTIFDVTTSSNGLRIAVGEGSVEYEGGGQRVALNAGEAGDISGSRARVRAIDAAAVGGWHNGRLAYEDASFEEIAADLNRSLDVEIAVSPEMRTRRFSGSFRLQGSTAATRERLETLLDVRIDANGQKWVIRRGGGAG